MRAVVGDQVRGPGTSRRNERETQGEGGGSESFHDHESVAPRLGIDLDSAVRENPAHVGLRQVALAQVGVAQVVESRFDHARRLGQ